MKGLESNKTHSSSDSERKTPRLQNDSTGVALTSDESDKVVGSVYDNLTEDIIGELDNVLAINRPNLFVTSFDAKVRFEWLLSDDCFNGFCSMHRSSYGKKKKQ